MIPTARATLRLGTRRSALATTQSRWVADRMGVKLLTCRWQRLDALIEVQSPTGGLAGLPGPAARARAGPTSQPP